MILSKEQKKKLEINILTLKIFLRSWGYCSWKEAKENASILIKNFKVYK